MKDWHLQTAKKEFKALESMFVTCEIEPEKYMRVKDGYVYSYLTQVYKIGESEDSFLERHSFAPGRNFYVSFCDLIDTDEWISEGDLQIRFSGVEELLQNWSETIERFIEDLDDEDVLVSVDYHM